MARGISIAAAAPVCVPTGARVRARQLLRRVKNEVSALMTSVRSTRRALDETLDDDEVCAGTMWHIRICSRNN